MKSPPALFVYNKGRQYTPSSFDLYSNVNSQTNPSLLCCATYWDDHGVAVWAVEGVDGDDAAAVRGLYPGATLVLSKKTSYTKSLCL